MLKIIIWILSILASLQKYIQAPGALIRGNTVYILDFC